MSRVRSSHRRQLGDGASRDADRSGKAEKFGRADLLIAALVLLLVVVARSGWTPPIRGVLVVAVVAGLAWGGLRTRSGALVAVALLLAVSTRAYSQSAALGAALPDGQVKGTARMITDPKYKLFGVQAVIDLEGRRYVASMPSKDAAVFKTLMAGETVHVVGKVRPIDSAPRGWVLSNHLAGRMQLRSVEARGTGEPWHRVANDLRRRIERSAGSMNSDDRALYLGLVIGDDRAQSDLQRYRFKASGLSHLLAVSGQNVSFLLAIASPLLRRVGPRTSMAIAVPILVVFALVTRTEPSVLRAVVMALVALLAVCTGREAQGLRRLSLTVILLVLIDPLIAHSVGFQLSVLATLGLIVLAEPVGERLVGPPWLREPLAFTVAAQLATAPVLFGFTDSVPAGATVANLLAVPVSGFVMMAGLTAGLLAGSIRADVGDILMIPVTWMVRWVDAVATVSSRLPLAPLTPLRFVLFSAVFAALLATRRKDGAGSGALRPLIRAMSVVGLIALVLPRPPGPGHVQLDGGAVLWRGHCGATAVVVAKGADGVTVLESLDSVHVNSVQVVVTDGSRSAQRAARYIREQYGVPTEVHSSDHGRAAGRELSGPQNVSLGDLVIDVRQGEPVVRIGSARTECRF